MLAQPLKLRLGEFAHLIKLGEASPQVFEADGILSVGVLELGALALGLGEPLQPRAHLTSRAAALGTPLHLDHRVQVRAQPLGVGEDRPHRLPHLGFQSIGPAVRHVAGFLAVVTPGRAAVVVEVLGRDGVGKHHLAAAAAASDPTGKLPEAVLAAGRAPVALYGISRGVYQLAGYAGVRDGYGYPLALGLHAGLRAPGVDPAAVGADLGHLARLPPRDVEVPDAVALLGVELRYDLRRDEFSHLCVGVRLVHVVEDEVANEALAPVASAARRGHALAVEDLLGTVELLAFPADHLEDAPHHGHSLGIYLVALAVCGVAEAVVGRMSRHHLAFARSLELAAPGPLGYLGALELGYLVEDAVGQVALRRVVTPVVQGADLGPVLLELSP